MVSIVVVHWNTPELLAACLHSISVSPSSSVREVVVVDCGSPGIAHVEVVAGFPEARLVESSTNDGYAAGCNLGTNATSSEIIFFLNADTEVLPGAVDTIADCFRVSSHAGLVAPLLLNRDRSIQSSGYRYPGVMNVICDLWPVPGRICASGLNGRIGPGNRFHPYAIDYPLGAALAVRRSALEQVGGWDESFGMYSEEIDLAKKLEKAGWLRLLEPRAEVIHHGGASTSQRPLEMQAALWRSRAIYHRRWSSRWRRALFRAALAAAPAFSTKDDADTHAAIRSAFAAGLGS
ncbi:MAG: glycosyltransferase family 2 protein [Thermomicrobiales bacterium]